VPVGSVGGVAGGRVPSGRAAGVAGPVPGIPWVGRGAVVGDGRRVGLGGAAVGDGGTAVGAGVSAGRVGEGAAAGVGGVAVGDGTDEVAAQAPSPSTSAQPQRIRRTVRPA
jgi:hypothetical protein